DAHPEADVSSIRIAPCGGAAVPPALLTALEERHGIEILHAWGMTETSPIGAVARPPAGASAEARLSARVSQGRPVPLVDLRIVDDAGVVQPWDGTATGEIQVRGPWIASGYYLSDSADDRFDDGWLRTGDVAAVDAQGYVRISDRSKDIIKSGGEWISSVELENELMSHDAVREAAVIAIADER
ncbi:long-chain fatty acid--CoA ligase, partial [Mycobacterium sp. ITM-2017-0098]